MNHRPSGYEPDELPLLYSAIRLRDLKKVDGVGGIEPPDDWTKTNCLTAWRYPIVKESGIIQRKISFVKIKSNKI